MFQISNNYTNSILYLQVLTLKVLIISFSDERLKIQITNNNKHSSDYIFNDKNFSVFRGKTIQISCKISIKKNIVI